VKSQGCGGAYPRFHIAEVIEIFLGWIIHCFIVENRIAEDLGRLAASPVGILKGASQVLDGRDKIGGNVCLPWPGILIESLSFVRHPWLLLYIAVICTVQAIYEGSVSKLGIY